MSRKQKPFAAEVSFTSIGNSFLDAILPAVSSTAGLLLLLVYRQTKGWQREKVALTYDAISAGLSRARKKSTSPATISRAIKELEALGILIVERGADKFAPSVYSINSGYEVDWSPVDLDCSQGGSVVAFPTSETEVDATSETEVDTTSETEVRPTSETEGYIGRNKINLLNKGGRKEPAPPSTESPDIDPAITTALEDAYPGHATNFSTIRRMFDLAVRLKAGSNDIAAFHDWLRASYPMKADTPFAFLDLFPEFVRSRQSAGQGKREYVSAPDDFRRRYYAS